MAKVINFEKARIRHEEIIMNKRLESMDELGQIIVETSELMAAPLVLLGIDQIVIDNRGQIIGTKIGKKWYKGIVGKIFLMPGDDE